MSRDRDLGEVLDAIKRVAPTLFARTDGSASPLARVRAYVPFTAPEAMYLRWVDAQSELNHLQNGRVLSALTKAQQKRVVAIWTGKKTR